MNPGDSFGKNFKVTTYGSSHDSEIGCYIEGCPAGVKIDLKEIQKDNDRRKPGGSRLVSLRKEPDEVELLSGIKDGVTTGEKIHLRILNKDVRSKDYSEIVHKPRPGHADLSNYLKYGEIPVGGGRSSGRETASRVMAAGVAKQILAEKGIKIHAEIVEINGKTENFDEIILEARKSGDSVGGVVKVTAENVPAGLGEPVFDKLDAQLAKALMSIPSIKGVEIGAGFGAARLKGSENNDPIELKDGKLVTKTNNAGGILGGISNGMPIVARIAVKPASSIGKEQSTVDLETMKPTKLKISGRHDPCICIRVVPVAEAMVALVLVDNLLQKS